MNALIFLVPEDIVDVRAKLVSTWKPATTQPESDLNIGSYFRWKSNEFENLKTN